MRFWGIPSGTPTGRGGFVSPGKQVFEHGIGQLFLMSLFAFPLVQERKVYRL